MKKLTFLHTSPIHVETFNGLLRDYEVEADVKHLVSEELLDRARMEGITPTLRDDVEHKILAAVEQGADVVLCTCSTIGDCAESVNQKTSSTVMRIDRAMAEQAVAVGPRIAVAATLASTIEPTLALINDAAEQAQKKVELSPVVFESAWSYFEAGNYSGYFEEIAARLPDAAQNRDVIVLAQGSMAQAVGLCGDLGVPVLSSPQIGLEAALAAIAHD